MISKIFNPIKSLRMPFKTIIFLISLMLTILFLTILSLENLHSSKNYILDKTNSFKMSTLTQTGLLLENNLNALKNLTRYMAKDKTLLDNLSIFNSVSSGSKNSLRQDILKYIERMKLQYDYINSIIILADTFNIYTSGNAEFFSKSYTDSIMSRLKLLINEEDANSVTLISPDKSVITGYTFVTGLYKDGKFLGYLCILLDSTIFTNALSKNSDLVLMNSQDNTFVIENDDIDFNIDKTGKQDFYHIKLFDGHFDLMLMQRSNEPDEYNNLVFLIVISFGLSILLAIVFSSLILKGILIPLNNLYNSVTRYKVGDGPSFEANKKNRFKITLRESILYFLFLVIIIPVIVFITTSYLLTNIVIEKCVKDSYTSSLNQTAENINSYIHFEEKILRSIVYNDTIQNALDKNIGAANTEITQIIDSLLQLSHGKESITIYDNEKKLFYSNDSPLHEKPYTADDIVNLLDNSDTTILWYKSSKDLYNIVQLNIFCRIVSLDNFSTIGYLHCQIDERELETLYDKRRDEGISIFIADMENEIISHKDKEKISAVLNDQAIAVQANKNKNMGYFQLTKELNNASWNLIGQYDYSLLKKDPSILIKEKIYIFIILIFMIIFVSFIVSYVLTNPLNKFHKILEMITVDNIETLFPETNVIQEINDLGKAFNDMIIRSEALIDEVVMATAVQEQLETQKKESELIALQAQINPHFLYNTFDSINWMIKCDNKKDAIEMVNNLSEMLRYTAKSSEPLVTVAEEIEYLKYYTRIMRIRFGNQLSFIWDLCPETLNNQMIRLTLQPIVENAIYHGIQPKQTKGVIRIYSYIKGETVILGVEDNGIGILPYSLNIMQQELDACNDQKKIGLFNVQKRIKIFFGDKYGIHVDSIPGEKTIVEICIPRKARHVDRTATLPG